MPYHETMLEDSAASSGDHSTPGVAVLTGADTEARSEALGGEVEAPALAAGALRPPQGWVRPLLVALTLALGLYALLFVIHAVRLAFATGELAFTESTWLLAATRVRHNLTPYFDYSHPPYIPMVYPPFAPGLAGAIGMMLNLSDDQMIPLARLVTVVSTIAVAGAIFALCRRLGGGRLPSLVAGMLFLTLPLLFNISGAMARGDLPALALSVWAVALVMLRPSGWGLFAGGMLAGLALCTKQNSVAPLVACAWWLLASGRRGGLLPLLSGSIAAVVVVFAPAGVDGVRLLLRGITDLASQPWTELPYYARLGEMVTLFGLAIPVALAGLLRPATPVAPRGLLLRYGAAALPVMLITSGKVGSTAVYDLELIAIIAVLAGLGIQWLTEVRYAEIPREVMAGLLALVLGPLLLQTTYALIIARNYRDPGPDDRTVMSLLAPLSGQVLSENGYIVLHGPEPPIIIDPNFFTVLTWQGRWDPNPLRRMVEEKRFSAVVLTHAVEAPIGYQGFPWLEGSIQQALIANYKFWAVNGRYYLYLPKMDDGR